MKDYEQIYRELGIQIEPLYNGYTPDEYAKRLLRDLQIPEGVTYSVSTNNNRNEKTSPQIDKTKGVGCF